MIITIVLNQAEPTPENPGEEVWIGGYRGPATEDVDQLPASILSMRKSDSKREPNLHEPIEVGKWYTIERLRELFGASRSDETAWSEVTVPVLTPDGEDNVLIQVEQNKCCDMVMQAVFNLTEQLDLGRQKGSVWIRVE